jgi:hypothetical protein
MAKTQGALSIPQFCQHYDVGRSKTYQEINAGRLKARKIGRKTLIVNADEWLATLPDMQIPTAAVAGGADARTS